MMNTFLVKKIESRELALQTHEIWKEEYKIAMRDFLSTSYHVLLDNDEYNNALKELWRLKNDHRKLKPYQLRALENGRDMKGVEVKYIYDICQYHGNTKHALIDPSKNFKETKICLKCCENKKKWSFEDFEKQMKEKHKNFRMRDV